MAKAPHFRLAGIPVRIEASFFVIIAIFGYLSQDPQNFQFAILLSWIGIAFVSVLLHELGHAVVFRMYGVSPSISIQGFGGLTSGSGRLEPRQHIAVSLAGPLSALFLIGLPALWVWHAGTVTSSAGQEVLFQVLFINVGWSVLNLLPILPLDGGNVTQSLLDLATQGRGRRPAEVISIVAAGALGLAGLAFGQVFIALFAAMFAMMNVRSLGEVKQQELGDEMVFAQRALIEHRPAEAEQVAHAVLARRPSGPALRAASELLGWARLWQGDQAGAEAAVTRYTHAGAPSATFRAAQALAAGRLVEGVSVMVWAFANEAAGPSQVLGAIAVAGTGQTRPFVSELLRLDGGAGLTAAVLFRQLLEYAGYHREAEVTASMLAADGRVGQPGQPGLDQRGI